MIDNARPPGSENEPHAPVHWSDRFEVTKGGQAWLVVDPPDGKIVAEICAQVRQAGGEFLHGGGDDKAERLYEHVAIGWRTHECHVSAEAFQLLADSAGLAPREIVRRLPAVELNRVPARARTQVGAIARR